MQNFLLFSSAGYHSSVTVTFFQSQIQSQTQSQSLQTLTKKTKNTLILFLLGLLQCSNAPCGHVFFFYMSPRLPGYVECTLYSEQNNDYTKICPHCPLQSSLFRAVSALSLSFSFSLFLSHRITTLTISYSLYSTSSQVSSLQ